MTSERHGAHNNSVCRRYAIGQELIYEVIIAELREKLLADVNMDRLRQCVRDRLEQRCRPDTRQFDPLQRRLREPDKPLDRFARNLKLENESEPG